MPLFDFRCKSCHTEFEALCKNNRAEGLTCPSCGDSSPDRLLSKFAISQNLTPCGTPSSAKGSSCGFNPNSGCGRCSQ